MSVYILATAKGIILCYQTSFPSGPQVQPIVNKFLFDFVPHIDVWVFVFSSVSAPRPPPPPSRPPSSHIHTLTHSHSLTHTHSLSLTHSHSLTHTHSLSLTHSLTHTLTHTLAQKHLTELLMWNASYVQKKHSSKPDRKW